MTKKAWGGRFQGESLGWVEAFNASIHFDKILIEKDIEGSIAHATMLEKKGILSEDEAEQIISGLKAVMEDFNAGRMELSVQHEDIHMNVERALINKIGEVGGKLHTGRSRNDQVATDMHLYIKEQVEHIIESINSLKKTILALAEENIHVIMPGYTHLNWLCGLSM